MLIKSVYFSSMQNVVAFLFRTCRRFKKSLSKMSWRSIFFLLIVFVINVTAGRVYYLDNIDNLRNSNPVFGNLDHFEQSSRDLDLSFSMEDSDDSNDSKNHIRPLEKVFAYAVPERPFLDANQDIGRPVAYYKITEFPTGRTALEEVLSNSDRSKKHMKNNARKGELVMEVRVIANNDASE